MHTMSLQRSKLPNFKNIKIESFAPRVSVAIQSKAILKLFCQEAFEGYCRFENVLSKSL
jgi:hypothetical protein